MNEQQHSLSIYDEIKNYLLYLKQMGGKGVEISPSSLKTVQKWGQAKIQKKYFSSPKKKQEVSKNDYEDLSELLLTVKACTKCPLHLTRKQIVFGAGDPKASIIFVGEAPGYEEDQTGKPFIGAAGKLLTRIIHAMHLNRDIVYICNIIKCSPPENRKPETEEINQCLQYLEKQIDIIQPIFICTLGTTASQAILKVKTPISQLRGNFHFYKGIKVMPTFHPSYLLKNESKKKEVWQDMQMIMREMKKTHN